MAFWLKKFIAFWLMPLPFCLTTMVVGLVLMRSPKRARLGRALFISAVVLLMLFSNKFVSRWLMRPLESRFPAIPEIAAGMPLPAQVAACRFVVVLGGGSGYDDGVSANNLLSSSALSRLVEGVRLLRHLPEAKLIVTGPGSPGRETHARVLARAAEALGIAPERILRVEQVRDTEDEAHGVHRIVGDAPVALATSSWHLPRAMALFRSAQVHTVACPSDYRSHADDPVHFDDFLWEVSALERSSLALRERIGYLWIWLRGKA